MTAAAGMGDVRPTLLFVGAFPPSGSRVFGGNLTDCNALLSSSFPRRVKLVPLDSSRGTGREPFVRRIALAASRTRQFVALVHGARPDAVLLFASAGLSFIEKSLYAGYARACGIPALVSVRSGHFIDQTRRSAVFRAVARVLLRAPARLLCQGARWQALFTDTFGLPATACPVVEAWVASEPLLEIGRARSPLPRAPVTLLFLGALEREKGIRELVDAVAVLRRDPGVPAFALVLAGEGTAGGDVRWWVDERGLSDVVSFPGVLAGEAMLDVIRRADAFVLPSYTEGLPNAMVEAMAAGLPVVVTPVGSVPDVIEHGVNGVLVPPHDTGALTRELRRVIASPALRAELGTRAHRTAAARFSTEGAAVLLERLVRDVVADWRSP